MEALSPLCSVISDIPGTLISGVWFWIAYGFSYYWYFIIPAIVIWVAVEIFTRHSRSFNSDNGFTPMFNSFVGGGVFCILSAFLHFILDLFAGKGIECVLLLINSLYLIPFIATGILLNAIGFWHYWRVPILNIKIDLFGRGLG